LTRELQDIKRKYFEQKRREQIKIEKERTDRKIQQQNLYEAVRSDRNL